MAKNKVALFFPDTVYIADNFLNNRSKISTTCCIICVVAGVSLVYSFV